MVNIINNVAVAECHTYEAEECRNALRDALTSIGGLDWVKPGMKIGIKLNLCAAKGPESAAVTHPMLAAELTKILKERGADVILGDSPGGPFVAQYINRLYKATGMTVCSEAGGILNTDLGTTEAVFPQGVSVRRFAYCAWLQECDAVINFCKLKSHGLMGITAAVKNLYGVIPGTYKSEYHFIHTDPTDFADMLVDLNEYVKPALCICDAVDIMEGNGPTQGTARHLGLIMAAKEPYNIDRIGAYLLGVKEKEIPFLTAAIRRNLLSEEPVFEHTEFLDQYRISDFKRSGATASWFMRSPQDRGFKKYAKKILYICMRSKPVCTGQCSACGHCAKSCPADAITIRNGRAHINRHKCVRCFCCQEFCPFGAMKVKRSPVARILGR